MWGDGGHIDVGGGVVHVNVGDGGGCIGLCQGGGGDGHVMLVVVVLSTQVVGW